MRKGQKTQRQKDEYARTRFWTFNQLPRDEKSLHQRHPASQQIHAHGRLCSQPQETPQIHPTQNKNPRQCPRNTPAGREFAYKQLKIAYFRTEKPPIASYDPFLEFAIFLKKNPQCPEKSQLKIKSTRKRGVVHQLPMFHAVFIQFVVLSI